MATITTNTSARDAFFANIRASLTDLFTTIVQHRQYRITMAELSSLSSRELDDLGLNRGDIKFVARKSVYGR